MRIKLTSAKVKVEVELEAELGNKDLLALMKPTHSAE